MKFAGGVLILAMVGYLFIAGGISLLFHMMVPYCGGSRGVRFNPIFGRKFTLKAREMASPTFQILKFSRGACPWTP